MVRVNGVAASTSSSWSTRTSNVVTRILAALPFAIPLWYDRRPFYHDSHTNLPHHRSKSGFAVARGRKGSRRSFLFIFMALAILTTFAILQWCLLSFLVIIKHDPKPNDNQDIYKTNEPLWTTCPVNGNDNDNGNDDGAKESGSRGSADDICFLTCIFGDNVETVDRPANVEWFDNYWCHTRFLLVTNLPALPAPGWTKIVVTNTTAATATASDERQEEGELEGQSSNHKITTESTTRKNIVLSRHAKFVAWEALPGIVPKHCAAVVYMDGYLAPIRYNSWWSLLSALVWTPPWSPASPLFLGNHLWYRKKSRQNQIPPPIKFQTLVKQVKNHPWGLSQVKQKYFDGLPMTTLLNNLVRDRKDTKEHVDTTLEWFRSQAATTSGGNAGHFQEIMPYYLNKYFAYDPNNARYRELSSSFWKTYTTYGGLWRDQPLWAYFLQRFNVTPAVMTTEGTITKGGDLFQTRGKLGWDKHVYT